MVWLCLTFDRTEASEEGGGGGGSAKEDDMVHSAKMGGALKILERMVNQNAEDEIFQDFKYWEVRATPWETARVTSMSLFAGLGFCACIFCINNIYPKSLHTPQYILVPSMHGPDHEISFNMVGHATIRTLC